MAELDDVVGEFDAGLFANKIVLAMQQVALGATECGKKGKVVIEMVFDAKLSGTGVNIAHTLKYVKPTQYGDVAEKSTTSTYMYVGKKGLLTISPEQQDDLFETSANVTKFKGN